CPGKEGRDPAGRVDCHPDLVCFVVKQWNDKSEKSAESAGNNLDINLQKFRFWLFLHEFVVS
ncbi:hypothetical protein, partial [Faecalibaculum rodentium]|uniref:hypothetical protein n=1 Tax=Faecalibaculum rodentium TaxID=1702221 RepID=UPI0025A29670